MQSYTVILRLILQEGSRGNIPLGLRTSPVHCSALSSRSAEARREGHSNSSTC
jgi:hypothetical protein